MHPGRKPLDDRRVLTCILFVLQSGIPWEMLPQEMGCGSGMTCWRRVRAWQKAGVWRKLHHVLLDKLRHFLHCGGIMLSIAEFDVHQSAELEAWQFVIVEVIQFRGEQHGLGETFLQLNMPLPGVGAALLLHIRMQHAVPLSRSSRGPD